jgi:DNA-binding transcriptional ArsR family regulator
MRYCEFQYVFVQFVTEHLVDCRKQLDGNLDDVLILAILGQSRIRAFLTASSGSPAAPGALGASRLADVSGIPRETVRRRLSALGRRGWITRLDDGSWSIAGTAGESPVRRDLAELDRRGMARMLRFHADLSRLLARWETPPG